MIEDALLPPLDLISASRAGRPWFVFEHAHAIDKIVKPDSEDTTSFSHSRLQHPRTLLWVPERQITAPAKGSELAARFFGGICEATDEAGTVVSLLCYVDDDQMSD